jgi:glycosyltransferase involved in cell wall biosynthesis
MNIGFDARYLTHGLIGGVRNYVFQLARHLPRLAPQHQFVYYIDAKAPLDDDSFPANVTLRTMPWRSPLSSAWNDLRISRWMERDRVDVAHFPGNNGPAGKYQLVVTLHDALNLFPMRQHWRGFGKSPKKVAMMAYLGCQSRAALRNARRVITVSEHARADIMARSGLPIERIRAIHSGCDAGFCRLVDRAALQRVRQRLALPPAFLLADGIKNPAALLEAYDGLPEEVRRRVALVFFTREAAARPAVAARLDGERIHVVVRPSQADLIALMNLTLAFVFPSWYEGFGLPLVEAMGCGAPVIASSRGSIPEVLGGAGLLFDVESSGELRQRLEQILGDEKLREQLGQQSLLRSQRFQWVETAKRVLEVYEEAFAPADASR